eukprot:g65910.t1
MRKEFQYQLFLNVLQAEMQNLDSAGNGQGSWTKPIGGQPAMDQRTGWTLLGSALTLSYVAYRRLHCPLLSSPQKPRFRTSVVAYEAMLRQTRLTLLQTAHDCQRFLSRWLDGRPHLLGFDCEWAPWKGQKVAVLQLSDGADTVLIRLNAVKDRSGRLPRAVLKLLESATILKVGVGCLHDAKKLRRDFGVAMRGCLELAPLLAPLLPHPPSQKKGVGLQTLCGELLHVQLVKDHKVVCSDWRGALTPQQILYAAADSFYGYQLGRLLQPEQCGMSVDFAHAPSSRNRPKTTAPTAAQSTAARAGPQTQLPNGKTLPPATTKLFENCPVFGPDGSTQIGYTNRRRLNYLLRTRRGSPVAPATSDGPPGVRLHQLPKSIESETPEWRKMALTKMNNICVVCGSLEQLRRLHVIPQAFHKHFPSVNVDRSLSLMVLACYGCHRQFEQCTAKLTHHLFQELGLLTAQQLQHTQQRGQDLAGLLARAQLPGYVPGPAAVKQVGRILDKHGHRMPPVRKQPLLAILGRHFHPAASNPASAVRTEDIKAASSLAVPGDDRDNEEKIKSRYRDAVQRLLQPDSPLSLPELCLRFKRSFLNELQPKYLDEGAREALLLPSSHRLRRLATD